MKLDEKFWVADIVFEDGFKLPNCAIFNEEPYRGQLALNDKDSIEAKFKKFPWYARGDGYIFFQNRNINGYFHVKNVSNYVIKEVTAKDY